ncbi:dephospho-CoA kinase [Candidatus Woesearchaeota archaeon]|nr:dephospho-CoA kinase [Candidatus Woesearchaeota archaeon]
MIIGVTGSVGSGKTAVAELFSRHHYSRIDADGIGHEILKKDKRIQKELVRNFGSRILDKNKNIARQKLGNAVFRDKNKLKKLDSIMHSPIIEEIKNQIKQVQKKCGKNAKIIIDAPLLLETKAKNLVDKVIVVKCSRENILKRNKRFTRLQIEKILKAQMPLNEKLKYADFVVDNNKGLGHLERQVEKIITELS